MSVPDFVKRNPSLSCYLRAFEKSEKHFKQNTPRFWNKSLKSLKRTLINCCQLIFAPDIMKEGTSKTESRGRRLLIAAIIFIAGAVVVLIAGFIFMQEEEIISLRGAVAELKPLQGTNVLQSYKTYHWTMGFNPAICNVVRLHSQAAQNTTHWKFLRCRAGACFCCFAV